MATVTATATATGGTGKPGVGVSVFLTRGDGRICLGVRKGSHGAGMLSTPGGHLEMYEDWATCAAREVAEETGLCLPPARFRFRGVTNDPMPAEGKHYVTIHVDAHISEAEAAAIVNAEPHKCAGWEWYAWPLLPDLPVFYSLMNLAAAEHGAFVPRARASNLYEAW